MSVKPAGGGWAPKNKAVAKRTPAGYNGQFSTGSVKQGVGPVAGPVKPKPKGVAKKWPPVGGGVKKSGGGAGVPSISTTSADDGDDTDDGETTPRMNDAAASAAASTPPSAAKKKAAAGNNGGAGDIGLASTPPVPRAKTKAAAKKRAAGTSTGPLEATPPSSPRAGPTEAMLSPTKTVAMAKKNADGTPMGCLLPEGGKSKKSPDVRLKWHPDVYEPETGKGVRRRAKEPVDKLFERLGLAEYIPQFEDLSYDGLFYLTKMDFLKRKVPLAVRTTLMNEIERLRVANKPVDMNEKFVKDGTKKSSKGGARGSIGVGGDSDSDDMLDGLLSDDEDDDSDFSPRSPRSPRAFDLSDDDDDDDDDGGGGSGGGDNDDDDDEFALLASSGSGGGVVAQVKSPSTPKSPRSGSADYQRMEQLLKSAGQESFVDAFRKEKIDFAALMLFSDDDLKTLGLALGPRKKLLAEVTNARRDVYNASVDRMLERLQLPELKPTFAKKKITFSSLLDMKDDDLKQLGLKFGARRKLLCTIYEVNHGAVPIKKQ